MVAASQKLIFETSMAALLKVAQGNVSAAAETQLNALGLHFGKKLEPAYPAELWASAVKVVAKDLFPQAEAMESHRLLALKTVDQFAETMVGKAIFAVARVMGPDRSLARMTHNFRTGANFIETKLTVIEPGVHELWLNDVSGVPGFYQGLIEGAALHTGRKPDTMSVKASDGVQCTFLLVRAKA